MNALQILILLIIGYDAITIDRKQKNFPLPFFIVAIGFGLSFIPYFNSITVSKEIIYNIFLPGLLFASAYHCSATSFKKHVKVIGTLSTVGLLVTALILCLAYIYIGWEQALKFHW